jgi:hypothetical protein
VRILASMVRSVGIRDANVEDSRRSAPPEAVDANVAEEFWRWLCAWSCCPRSSTGSSSVIVGPNN